MLHLVHLSHIFFKNQVRAAAPVLQDINLTVERGQFLCLVGPNGCGKTTLLRIIAGLIAPTHGKVLLDAREIKTPGQGIGLVFQEVALLPWRTVWQNIELGMARKYYPRAERARIIRAHIAQFGLEDFEHCFPKELSGGMKQKVAIARALVNEPHVLLMDEPFAALDAQSRNFLQEFLVRLWQTDGKTIIFVTHNVDEAIFLAERIIVMRKRPTAIKLDLAIDLPYPRDRTCGQFNAIRKEILASLQQETYPENSKLGYFSQGN